LKEEFIPTIVLPMAILQINNFKHTDKKGVNWILLAGRKISKKAPKKVRNMRTLSYICKQAL
jgi:hypothetical protein